jgi:hypothetical protein
VLGMFNKSNDWENFKTTIRDLLISMKEFAANKDDLYAEEKAVNKKIYFLD